MKLNEYTTRCLDDSCHNHAICKRWTDRENGFVVMYSGQIGGSCEWFILDAVAQMEIADELTRLGQEMGDYD